MASLDTDSSSETLSCALAGRCGGCPWIHLPRSTQQAQRAAALRTAWEAAGLVLPSTPLVQHATALGGLRDRVDLTLEDGRLGLYALETVPDQPRAVVDMAACPILSPALEAWLVDFRADLPPLRQASVRLRVGPDGQRGLWLDAANEDIKVLLEARSWLERQHARAIVELGQRRKALEVTPERLRLRKAPRPAAWMQTFPGAEDTPAQDLYGLVGGFTQPGRLTNRVLVAVVREQIDRIGAARWLELFAGGGNFTVPLAARAVRVDAWEEDPVALAGLSRAAAEQGLTARIHAQALNVHRASPRLHAALDAARPDAILADPPRSGLGGFLEVLAESPRRPATLLYVSCYAESLVADAVRLAAQGYQATVIVGVDQFPHTPHGEWVVVFSAPPSEAADPA